MFGSSARQPRAVEPGRIVAILAVAAVLVAIQIAALVTLVARPLERAVAAAREPAPARVLVRVPEYVEEIEVVGPPRWQRDLLRLEASRRADPLWLADQGAAPVPLVCRTSAR